MKLATFKIHFRIYMRRFKKYSAISALTGFVVIVSFTILEITHRLVRARIDEYKRQTTILNPEVLLKPKYDVILSAYMNSGSTFTGRFLGFRPDTFYMYEPLWHLSVWDYYKDNFTLCNSRVAVCRALTGKEANKNVPLVGPGRHLDLKILHDSDITEDSFPLTIPQRILEHVFNCRLSLLASIIVPGVTSEPKFAGSGWSSFNMCLSKRTKIEVCLSALSETCKKAPHRVAKVLRVSVQALGPFLKNNPKLKIIHLFRDPRAVIHSRIETAGYPLKFSPRGSPEIRSNAKALCDKMATDLAEGKHLMEKYPNQFRFIHYEDIYNNEKSLIKLHSILGMEVTQLQLDRVRKDGQVNDPSRYTGDRSHHRETNNAYWWTNYMQWRIIQTVDTSCSHLYTSLGYPVFDTEEDLQQMDINETLSNLMFNL